MLRATYAKDKDTGTVGMLHAGALEQTGVYKRRSAGGCPIPALVLSGSISQDMMQCTTHAKDKDTGTMGVLYTGATQVNG